METINKNDKQTEENENEETKEDLEEDLIFTLNKMDTLIEMRGQIELKKEVTRGELALLLGDIWEIGKFIDYMAFFAPKGTFQGTKKVQKELYDFVNNTSEKMRAEGKEKLTGTEFDNFSLVLKELIQELRATMISECYKVIKA